MSADNQVNSLTQNQLILLYFHKVLSGKTVGVPAAVSSWVTVGTTR